MIFNKIDKKTLIIIIVIILIALGAGGYFYWSKKTNTETEKIIENSTKGALPSINTNPLENKPDINPADKANPYKNIKTNPF